jgi:diaminohydroxyphosphoribosylaminopyrimidine deaminase/5-amino-6-(5-phosphoribosylamino)uracil reductase
MDDSHFMRKALALAERGRGRTSPNPMVGALVVDDDGVIVGRGAHEITGGPHAEVIALRAAGARARGATLYCTLEPCSHTGRTGPCAPLVVEAGIRRAVIAIQDPNPLVQGRGLGHLRDRGLDVTVGVEQAAAERQNTAFLTSMRRGRPGRWPATPRRSRRARPFVSRRRPRSSHSGTGASRRPLGPARC